MKKLSYILSVTILFSFTSPTYTQDFYKFKYKPIKNIKYKIEKDKIFMERHRNRTTCLYSAEKADNGQLKTTFKIVEDNTSCWNTFLFKFGWILPLHSRFIYLTDKSGGVKKTLKEASKYKLFRNIDIKNSKNLYARKLLIPLTFPIVPIVQGEAYKFTETVTIDKKETKVPYSFKLVDVASGSIAYFTIHSHQDKKPKLEFDGYFDLKKGYWKSWTFYKYTKGEKKIFSRFTQVD